MATKNPFGQLRVERDEDEVPQTTSKQATATPLFVNAQAAEKKKKKVRPEDKKRTDEPVQDTTEGFEVVGKPKPQKHQRKYNPSEEEVSGEGKIKDDNHANKHQGLGHHIHNPRPVRGGKRQFDRHSGTGRGKEVAKGGAGGKTVWGDNNEFIAKQSMREDFTNDKFFDYALNPRPKKDKEDITETQVAEEASKAQETPAFDQTQAREETQEYERFKKKPAAEEKTINPEDLLDIPENALSLAEYREQLKEKNRKVLGSTGNAQLNFQLPSDLKKLEKDTFGVKASEKKPVAKQAKKENNFQEIAVNFKTEDAEFQRGNDDYNYKKKSKPAPKLRFEDLPSL